MTGDQDTIEIRTGKAVYDGDGNVLGTVRGFDESGFYVTAQRNVEVLAEERVGSEPSDALMWRCWECGEMGQLKGLPEECPSCGAPKEDIYYWQED